MLRILLVCSGGFTSGMFAKKMNASIQKSNIPWEVFSANISIGLYDYQRYDVVLLAPQVSITFDTFEEKTIASDLKILQLEEKDFVLLNVDKIIKNVQQLLGSGMIKRLDVVYVCKEKGKNSGFVEGLLKCIADNKYEIDVRAVAISEIFADEFACDFIVMDFEFYNIQNPMSGFITSKRIPFMILHLYYVSGMFHKEVVQCILSEYAKSKQTR